MIIPFLFVYCWIGGSKENTTHHCVVFSVIHLLPAGFASVAAHRDSPSAAASYRSANHDAISGTYGAAKRTYKSANSAANRCAKTSGCKHPVCARARVHEAATTVVALGVGALTITGSIDVINACHAGVTGKKAASNQFLFSNIQLTHT
jgi:hypothetical protein